MHVHAVGQRDQRPRPADQPQRSRRVDLAEVAGPVPAVRRERLGGRFWVVPVPVEHGGSSDDDLAVGLHPHLERRQDPAHAVVRGLPSEVGRDEPAFRGAVALDHLDAERLPAVLEAGGQVRGRAEDQSQLTAEGRVDLLEHLAAQLHRKVRGEPQRPPERLAAAALVRLAADRAEQQLEDLRHDDERGRAVALMAAAMRSGRSVVMYSVSALAATA